MAGKEKALPTVADLLSHKGQKQLTMMKFFTLEEAAAAEVPSGKFII